MWFVLFFQDNVDLGDLMFSLCYLPTAGRLTITMIKARNLKAMDITGASGKQRKSMWSCWGPQGNWTSFLLSSFTCADPYVKVSLMCEGRRLKKRKTSTKRNTLNPIYNEAIVFDVPPENIEQISLLIAVMDYDRLDFFMKKETIQKKKKIRNTILCISLIFQKTCLRHESAESS